MGFYFPFATHPGYVTYGAGDVGCLVSSMLRWIFSLAMLYFGVLSFLLSRRPRKNSNGGSNRDGIVQTVAMERQGTKGREDEKNMCLQCPRTNAPFRANNTAVRTFGIAGRALKKCPA